MKRGLVLSLCAAAVVAMTSPALADIDVQLNLRYTDPNNATGGGTWDLLVQDNGASNGVAGIKVDLIGDVGVTGVDTGPVTAGVFNNTDDVFRFQLLGSGNTEIVAGDNLDGPGASLTGVGKGAGTPGNVADDDLFLGGASSGWNDSALIASGSWTGARPDIAQILANEFDGTTAVSASIAISSVRGDSVGVDMLRPGDANRSGGVTIDDFNLLAANFGGSGTWNTGDFNSSGTVTIEDFNLLAANFGSTSAPPAISAVPEPTSIAILTFGAATVMLRRRR